MTKTGGGGGGVIRVVEKIEIQLLRVVTVKQGANYYDTGKNNSNNC